MLKWMKEKWTENTMFYCLYFISVINTLLLCGFVLNLLLDYYNAQKVREESKYISDYYIVVDRDMYLEVESTMIESKAKLEKLHNIKQGNIVLRVSCPIGKSLYPLGCEVYVTQNERIKYPLKSGKYFNGDSKYSSNQAVIGMGILPYTNKVEEKRYLEINNAQYEVIGILKDNIGFQTDKRILVSYQYMDEGLKEELYKQFMNNYFEQVIFQSESFEVQHSYQALCSWIQREWYCAIGSHLEEAYFNNGSVEFYQKIFKILTLFIFLICIGVCITLAQLVYYRNKKSIVIMRAFGMSKIKIILLYQKNLFIIYLTAFSVMCFIYHDWLLIKAALAFVLFLFVLTLLPLLYLLNKMSLNNIRK